MPVVPPVVVVAPKVEVPVVTPVVAAPSMHSVTVTKTPAGGELWDGETLLGKLNGSFQVPHSTTSRSLTAKKKGYRDYFFVLTPSSDVQLHAEYEPLPRKGGGTPVHKAQRDPTTTTTTAVKVDTPTPPVVRPKPERHDLMDPFENK